MRVAALLLWSTAAFAQITSVDVSGHYYETCACKVSCPCATKKFLPTEGHCDAMMLLHFDKASVGKTRLDGLNLVMVLKSPNNQIFADAFDKGAMDHLAIYLDAKANDEQKQVFPVVLSALFGNKEFKNQKPPEFQPITVAIEGDTAKFDVGAGKLTANIENFRIGDVQKVGRVEPKRIRLENVVPFPWVSGVTQGRSNSFHYADGAIKWDYKDRNAFFGVFNHRSTFIAEPTK